MIDLLDFEMCSLKEDARIYHARRGLGIKDGKRLGSHTLIDYIDNPMLFECIHVKQTVKKKENHNLQKGSAIHKYVLEGREAFFNSFNVGFPINQSTGKEFGGDTKKVSEHTKFSDKPHVGAQELLDIQKIDSCIRKHKEAREMIIGGLCERTILYNYEGVDCQIRIDCFNPQFGICDLKKTSNMRRFLRDAGKFGYWIQAGFYEKIFEEATGEKVDFNWIVCEDVHPFEVVTYKLNPDHLDYAKRKVESGILEFKEAIKYNQFLTGREGLQEADWWEAMQNESEITL